MSNRFCLQYSVLLPFVLAGRTFLESEMVVVLLILCQAYLFDLGYYGN